MNTNSEELIKSSLVDENSFSSNSHVIDTLVKEGEPSIPEYEIPSRYNKDTLRMLFVNTQKYYVYWEVSDKTLQNSGLDLTIEKLHFKIYDTKGNELYSFESSFSLGDYYIKKKFENLDIYVKIGKILDNEFVELQTSNTIHTFSSKINLPEELDEAWLKKNYGWSEVIRSTIQHYSGASSASYIEEMERIKHFIEEENLKFSSSSFQKVNKND